jgi:hypothetical protein
MDRERLEAEIRALAPRCLPRVWEVTRRVLGRGEDLPRAALRAELATALRDLEDEVRRFGLDYEDFVESCVESAAEQAEGLRRIVAKLRPSWVGRLTRREAFEHAAAVHTANLAATLPADSPPGKPPGGPARPSDN